MSGKTEMLEPVPSPSSRSTCDRFRSASSCQTMVWLLGSLCFHAAFEPSLLTYYLFVRQLEKVTVLFLNLAAPSTVKQEHVTAGMNVLQYYLADDARTMGLVVLPVFSYTRNGVWNEMNTVMRYLNAAEAHTDKSWFPCYKEKCAGALRFHGPCLQ